MIKRTFIFVLIILMSSFIFASNTTDVNITNNLPTNLTNYEVKLTLDQTNVSESFDWDNSGNDIRIITTDNQYLNFWIEDFNSTSKIANIWVKIPLLEASSTYKIKVKYNQGAQNLSNGDNTFIFFDDFSEDKTVLYSRFGLASATDPLTIPTYDGSGRNVHPSLVYFEEPFNGWKYWMAFTPYLDSNAFFENPSIVVSNDGNTWQVPDGLTNPIDLPSEGGNNSDPSLFYDGEKFILYYREFFNTTERINYRYSLDGNTWSEEQTVLNDRKYKFIAPTVIKKEEIYYMWVVESDYVLGNNDSGGCKATDSNLVRYESDDGVSWTNPVVNTTGLIDSNLVLWHPDIKYIPEKEEYWMVFSAHNSITPDCSYSETYFARSPDGLTWTTYLDKKTLGKLESGWQKGSIYKSTFLYDEASNKIRVWYSGNDAGYPITAWNTGYTEENYDVFLKRVDINSTKWQIHKEGSQEVSIIYDSGELKLKGKTDVISSANISTTHLLPNNNFIVEVKQKISERNYVGTSLGTLNNGLLCYSGSGSLNNSTLCNGYFFANWSTNWYLRFVTTVSSNSGQITLVEPSTVNTYHKLKYVYTNSGFLGWYIDDILKASRTHTTYLSYPKYLMFSQGEYNSTPKGGTRTIDYVFVRNYASTEPTVTSEINNEIVLTYISGDNGTIDGDTNQIIIKGQDGAAVTAIPNTGYRFVSWSDGNNSAIRQDTNVQADISVTANFDVNTYTVLFKDWNGEVLKTEDVNYGDGATAPADPIRTGYTFNGWDVAFNNIISDLNITAQYTISTYTVLFKDWNGEVLKNEDVNYGDGATAPADPTRPGYTFNGWDVAFNNIISDLNVAAQYTINQYTITFDSNGGAAVSSITQDYNTSISAPTSPTRTGYTFAGWLPELPTLMPDSNNTHIAQWVAIVTGPTVVVYNEDVWFNQDFNLSFDVNFDPNPEDVAKYKFNSSDWNDFTGDYNILINQDGNHEVQYWFRDSIGQDTNGIVYALRDANVSVISNLVVSNITTTSARITITVVEDNTASCRYSLQDLNYNSMNEVTTKTGNSNYWGITGLSSNTDYVVYFRCKDQANNYSDKNSVSFKTSTQSSSGGSSSGSSSSSSSTSSTSSQPISEQPRTIEIINTNENPSNSVQEKQETLKENEIQLIDQEILSKNEVDISRRTTGEITKTKANLNVIIKVKNKTNKLREVSVVEVIPKEIADHVDKINFKIQPTEIINPDPIVLWKLTLSPNQDLNLEYSVNDIADTNLLKDYNSIIQNWVTPIVTTKIELIPIIETKECIDTDKDPCTISVLIDNECITKKICYEQTPKENKIVRAKFNYLPIVLLVLVLLIIWLLFNIIEPKNKYPKLNYNKPSLFIRKRKSKKK